MSTFFDYFKDNLLLHANNICKMLEIPIPEITFAPALKVSNRLIDPDGTIVYERSAEVLSTFSPEDVKDDFEYPGIYFNSKQNQLFISEHIAFVNKNGQLQTVSPTAADIIYLLSQELYHITQQSHHISYPDGAEGIMNSDIAANGFALAYCCSKQTGFWPKDLSFKYLLGSVKAKGNTNLIIDEAYRFSEKFDLGSDSKIKTVRSELGVN